MEAATAQPRGSGGVGARGVYGRVSGTLGSVTGFPCGLFALPAMGPRWTGRAGRRCPHRCHRWRCGER